MQEICDDVLSEEVGFEPVTSDKIFRPQTPRKVNSTLVRMNLALLLLVEGALRFYGTAQHFQR